MSIHHHLSDETLMAYAAGTLGEAHGFVVATHLSMCAQCRDRVSEMEQIGAHELETLPRSQMSAGALDNVLAMLDEDVVQQKPAPANDLGPADVPMPLRQYLPLGIDGVAWKNMAPGIKTFTIPALNSNEGSLRLLKIAPGITIPEHGHNGSELTLVLRGSFSDEIGRFKSGDIADLDSDIEHQPISDSDEDCICLAATEGQLRFKAMVPRLMQYFVGM